MRRFAFLGLGLAFAGVLAASPAAAAGDAEEGEKVFRRCKACHSLEPGQHRVGPSLAGVFGREAGAAEGFDRYSEAMKNADLVWNEENLDHYLANPNEFIPGNKMVFPGLGDEEDREDVIAYLKQETQ